jgi:hypothetical protein
VRYPFPIVWPTGVRYTGMECRGARAKTEARGNRRHGSLAMLKHMAKPFQAGRRAARALVSGLFLAIMLLLLAPSSSYLAIEQPHVGFGAFLAERSDAYLVADMEFDWLVWNLQWSLAEPSKGDYRWQGLDELLDYADTLDLKVILRVDSAPDWARSGAQGAPPDLMSDFGDFMFALAAHCAGEVAGYVIWNEPNLPTNWGGSPSAPQYVQMLQAVYPRIKAADPDAAVVTAGMATTGGPGGSLCGLVTGLTGEPLSA